MGFDIIGDIHGHHDKLLALLKLMGYRKRAGAWRCSGRSAVFVGDLIDRGPGQLATVDLVRRMVDAGSARCVMGNHEFNAIAWSMPDPLVPGEYLRPHGKPGNRAQHEKFLTAVENTPRHADIVDWFRTLPLWIDLQGIRVVHACWDEPSMQKLRPFMGPGDTLTDELMLMGSRPGSWAYAAIETICKGPEVELPNGAAFYDKSGKRRTEVRVRWWQSDLSTYRKAVIGPAEEMALIPDAPMPETWRAHGIEGTPVVFGHYWFSGTPTVISGQFACIDYSVATDGPLVAYRWDGESEMTSDKLAWAGAEAAPWVLT